MLLHWKCIFMIKSFPEQQHQLSSVVGPSHLWSLCYFIFYKLITDFSISELMQHSCFFLPASNSKEQLFPGVDALSTRSDAGMNPLGNTGWRPAAKRLQSTMTTENTVKKEADVSTQILLSVSALGCSECHDIEVLISGSRFTRVKFMFSFTQWIKCD